MNTYYKYQNVSFNKTLNELRLKKIIEFIPEKRNACIELGCGEGHINNALADLFSRVVAVDIEQGAIDEYKQRTGIKENVEVIVGDVLQIPPADYDYVVVTNILEHVDDADKTLAHIHKFGNKDTVFLFTVPNGKGVNRLLGVDLGMLDDPLELGQHDIDAGHQRMYTRQSFIDAITRAGFTITTQKTFFYKPFPNNIMEHLSEDIINFCSELKTKETGAEILVVARR